MHSPRVCTTRKQLFETGTYYFVAPFDKSFLSKINVTSGVPKLFFHKLISGPDRPPRSFGLRSLLRLEQLLMLLMLRIFTELWKPGGTVVEFCMSTEATAKEFHVHPEKSKTDGCGLENGRLSTSRPFILRVFVEQVFNRLSDIKKCD